MKLVECIALKVLIRTLLIILVDNVISGAINVLVKK